MNGEDAAAPAVPAATTVVSVSVTLMAKHPVSF